MGRRQWSAPHDPRGHRRPAAAAGGGRPGGRSARAPRAIWPNAWFASRSSSASARPRRRGCEWKEGKGPKCVPARAIAGATLVGRSSVDLILRNRQRVRAKLESSCPALDYYYGFYITPNPDGMVCEDRDNIRSRMGGACEIDRFRSLEPVVRR